MQYVRRQMRYAHAEGHTDVCYTDDGKFILTCGSDGDVRSWTGIEDDDPTSECVGELALAVAYHKKRFFVGTDNNYVQAYTYPDRKRDGVISRFSAPVTHIVVSEDGKKVAAAACDMEIQVTELDTNSTIRLTGHVAPILGVAFDPKDKYVASASCDGSVRVWDLQSATTVKTFPDLVPKSNDFFRATNLGRGAWQQGSGSYLALPKEKSVVLYQRDTWDVKEELTDTRIQQALSIVTFSVDGNFIAAASVGGEIIIWDVHRAVVVSYTEHPKRCAITGLAWHPDGKEMVFCDALGQLGVMEQSYEQIIPAPERVETGVDMSDDENLVSIRDIKAASGWMSPSDTRAVEDDASSAHDDDVASRRSEVVRMPPLTELQPPFQPSATPQHLQHRFMTWNHVGIVRCFDTEDEKSVDVEFHDTMFHHALHINNYEDYTIAALSEKVLAMSSQGTDDSPSKLTCVLFNAWDGSKEWSLALPEGETALAVAAAGNWVALATSRNFVRLYSFAGTQRQILTLPGSVVCMAGCAQKLMVIYHDGTGAPGCQKLNCMMFDITTIHVRTSRSACGVPLSPKSTLKWAGFSDEGTPLVYDSLGILHVQPYGSSHWTVACDTTLHRRGVSDHYFVIGVSEKEQNVRCVLCKGAYYPPTTPRPTVVEIALRLPYSDPESDKTVNEEVFWKGMAVLPVLQTLARESPEYEAHINDLEKTLKQTIIKLFANACRSDNDMRATDVASLMTSQALQMAAKYASKMGKMYLAEKLGSVDPVDWSVPSWLPGMAAVYDVAPSGSEEQQEASYNSHAKAALYSQQDMFEDSPMEDNRLLAAEKESEVTSHDVSVITPARLNPFKVKGKSDANLKGLNFFDKQKVITMKPGKIEPKKVEKAMKSKKNIDTQTNKKTTFIQWFANNKAELKEEFPEMNLNELTKTGMKRFREISSQQKEDSQNLSLNGSKRKGETESEDQPIAKKTAADILSVFAAKNK